MSKSIMIQGTMSNAGKSLLTAGICRVLAEDGIKVAPFKSQNMALNSFITKEGYEMGRAQVMQAEAAGVEPSVKMNPILLKPTNENGSQVIVNGEVLKNMTAREYFAYKDQLIPHIRKAYASLEEEYEVIVIEGAGSPAEINLKQVDIVNMGMAKLVDAPVVLVGDIDRGGVFAQLYGTVMLLDEEERARVKGFIVNKFRGDQSILMPGIEMLEEKLQIPCLGVVPYLKIDVEDEDSLSERLDSGKEVELIDIAVIRLPRLSNFTDFNRFSAVKGVSVRYISNISELKNPDLIILPGTKNTMEDLLWMRQNGLEGKIIKANQMGTPVFGICGGYQMLGEMILDPRKTESGGSIRGMELLPMTTEFFEEKTRTRVEGKFLKVTGVLESLTGLSIEGYEIHMGQSIWRETSEALVKMKDVITEKSTYEGGFKGSVYGSYVHGIFDKEDIVKVVISDLARKKGISLEELETMDYESYKQQEYDKLSRGIRDSLDMKKIYEIIG